MSNQSSSGGSESSKQSKRNKKNQLRDDDTIEKLTKEEKQIARYLRLNGPKKQGSLLGMKVDFFISSKLIDFLMDSKWGPGLSSQPKPASKPPLLANRQACVAFVQRLMNKQLFYRAIKIYKEETSSSAAVTATESEATPSLKKRTTTKTEEGTPSSEKLKKDTKEQQQQQQQAKKKFKLEMHEDQKFMDANEPYVWVYDPTSTKTYIIGSLLILGAIGICLFPLWPSQVREGVYYLSLAGASFLGAILGLAIFKYVLFAALWVCTFGSLHFWLFPNLTEDVSFLESFQPIYKCNCSKASTKSEDENLKKKKKDDDFETSDNNNEKPNEDDANVEVINDVEVNTNNNNNTSSMTTSKLSKSSLTLETSSTELSKSTVEITKLVEQHPTPSSLKRRKSSTNKEDDGFELVDDEDLNNK